MRYSLETPFVLRCAPYAWGYSRPTNLGASEMRYYVCEAVMVRSAVGMTDALQRERRGGPQGGPVFS